MERKRLNILDKNFNTDDSSCHGSNSRYIEWVRTNEPVSTSVFITDLCLGEVRKATEYVKRPVAWIHEPRAIHPHVYSWIEKHNNLFSFVLTYDEYLLEKGQNYLYYPHGRCWIKQGHTPPAFKDKSKFCSIIASSKNFTQGHKLRHEVIQKVCKDAGVDVFGYGYKPVENKAEALDDYKFSITIENSNQPGYWTEKVVDCFATNTVPIYWGNTSVNKYFDPAGMVYMNNVEHLKEVLQNLHHINFDQQVIDYNRNQVEKYRVPEDWMFEQYPWLFT